MLWNGTGDGIEVAELREVGCAGGTVGEEVWACCLEWAGCEGLVWCKLRFGCLELGGTVEGDGDDVLSQVSYESTVPSCILQLLPQI